MRSPWMLSLIGGLAVLSLTACADSIHQTQRLAVLSHAQDNDYADVYYDNSPFFYSPGFWWSPFAYYPGYYGPGYPGYPYPGYYRGSPPGGGGSAPPPTPPRNAPPQFFKRKD